MIIALLAGLLAGLPQAYGDVDCAGVLSANDDEIAVDSIRWTFPSSPAPRLDRTPGWEAAPGGYDTFQFPVSLEWPQTGMLFCTQNGRPEQYFIDPVIPDTWYTLALCTDAPAQVLFADTILQGVAEPAYPRTPVTIECRPTIFREAVRLAVTDRPFRRIQICDHSGRVVRQFSGGTPVVWDGRDESGTRAAPGVYLVRIAGRPGSTRLILIE